MVKILYLIVRETFDKSYCVQLCFLWFMFVWIFTRNMFSINHYVLEVQYFSLWLHYDNLWKISIYYTVTELWKPTLKYNNLFSLTSR